MNKTSALGLGVFLGVFSLSGDASADSAAAPTTPGYLSTSCGTQAPPCFIQYGATVPISGSISASLVNPTIGAAVPATGNYIAGNQGGLLAGVLLDGSGFLEVNCAAGCAGGSFNNNADAVATSATNGQSAVWNYIFNGTTFDRQREAVNATNSTGTGIPIGALAGNFDDVSPVSCTENQFCNLRMGSAGALHVELWQSNGANALAFGGPADGGSNAINTAIFQAWGVIYNGSTWDRMREVANSANTTGTGIMASGLMGQCDDTSPTGISENSFGNLRMDCTDHSQTMGGIATTGAPTYSTATARALSLTTAGALRVDGSAATQPVSGTVTASQATAANLNATVVGTGTFAVQATNATTASLNATVVGVGTAGTAIGGVMTVQGTASMTKLLVTPDSVALPANQSVNVAQMNGVTTTMGNGVSGTGVQRVAIASDNTAVSGVGAAATGAAVPANAVYQGANTAGNLTGLIACNTATVYDNNTNGSTQLVASGSSVIYICGYTIFSAGTTNVDLIQGTGTACASSPVKLTPAYQLTAQTGVVDGSPYYRGMNAPTGKQLCISTSATVSVQAVVYTTQF